MLRDAAEAQSLEARAPMRAHDDEGVVLLGGEIDDLCRRALAPGDRPFDIHPACAERGGDALEVVDRRRRRMLVGGTTVVTCDTEEVRDAEILQLRNEYS